ncbi:MAG TPA: acyltransferase [Candidatus Aquilonibacter sp.]|nr:acyltransferase [Candidatus Aquilonibacter sp.]
MARRIPELDGLRALAILSVFIGHAEVFPLRMMWIGVDLFFVLSGFLITGILLDTPKQSFRRYIGTFYERRARRILPPYILILVFVSIVFGTWWMRHWYLYFGLMNYVGYFWKEPFYAPLASLWSLGVEEQFYLIWPIVIFFVGAKRLPKLLVAGLLIAPALRAAFTPWLAHQAFDTYHWTIYKGTIFRFDCLASGSLITFLWRTKADKVQRYGWLGIIPALLTPPTMFLLNRYVGGFSTYGNSMKANVLTYEISLVAVSGLMLWALSGRYTQVLRLAPLRWIARISYSFYLVHESMLLLANRYVHTRALAALVAATGCIVYSELSWRWLERPILHGGNRRAAEREVHAASVHGEGTLVER